MAKAFTFSGRLRSFKFAFRGIRLMLRSQHNAWVHAAASAGVVMIGWICGLSCEQWCLIALAIVGVWAAEALNTAFEFLCDVASPELHPMVEKSKDVAAGAVLLAAIGAVVVGLLIFGPHVLARFRVH